MSAAARGPEPRHRSSEPLAVVFLDGAYEDAAYYRAWAAAAGLVVAADGGARFLLGAGGAPDVVVGDFDSLPPADAERLAGLGVATVRHPTRKDQTDGELAVDEALRRGAGELVLAGALGALDHTLGHLAILRRLAERGVPARLAAPDLMRARPGRAGEARCSTPNPARACPSSRSARTPSSRSRASTTR